MKNRIQIWWKKTTFNYWMSWVWLFMAVLGATTMVAVVFSDEGDTAIIASAGASAGCLALSKVYNIMDILERKNTDE